MKTYYSEITGADRLDRRIARRVFPTNERVEHLFDGFRNMIENAKLADDDYAAGYLVAMRLEFATLLIEVPRAVVQALDAIVALTHQPNPVDSSVHRVKAGNGKAFDQAIAKAIEVLR